MTPPSPGPDALQRRLLEWLDTVPIEHQPWMSQHAQLIRDAASALTSQATPADAVATPSEEGKADPSRIEVLLALIEKDETVTALRAQLHAQDEAIATLKAERLKAERDVFNIVHRGGLEQAEAERDARTAGASSGDPITKPVR